VNGEQLWQVLWRLSQKDGRWRGTRRRRGRALTATGSETSTPFSVQSVRGAGPNASGCPAASTPITPTTTNEILDALIATQTVSVGLCLLTSRHNSSAVGSGGKCVHRSQTAQCLSAAISPNDSLIGPRQIEHGGIMGRGGGGGDGGLGTRRVCCGGRCVCRERATVHRIRYSPGTVFLPTRYLSVCAAWALRGRVQSLPCSCSLPHSQFLVPVPVGCPSLALQWCMIGMLLLLGGVFSGLSLGLMQLDPNRLRIVSVGHTLSDRTCHFIKKHPPHPPPTTHHPPITHAHARAHTHNNTHAHFRARVHTQTIRTYSATIFRLESQEQQHRRSGQS
jgi:hypothetical protein